MSDFYAKPVHVRLAQRILEGLVSLAAVHLLSPTLLDSLAPLQARLNASALNNGLVPPTQGVNAVANTLIVPPGGAGTVTIPSNTGT